jgi:hypothetical protein
VSARSSALIFDAYRIHIEAVKVLTVNSYEIAQVSGKILERTEALQSVSIWLLQVKSELERQNENALLD